MECSTGISLVHNIMGMFSPRLKRTFEKGSQSPPRVNNENSEVQKPDDSLISQSPPKSSSPKAEIDIPFPCPIQLRLSNRFNNRISLAAAREQRRSLKAPIAPQELVDKFVGLQDMKSSAFRRSKKFGEDGSKRNSEVWTVENKGRATPDDEIELISLCQQPSINPQEETEQLPTCTESSENHEILEILAPPMVNSEPIRSDSIDNHLMNDSRWGNDFIKSRISVFNTDGRPSEFWLSGPDLTTPTSTVQDLSIPTYTKMDPPPTIANKIDNTLTTFRPIDTTATVDQVKKRKDSPSDMLPPPKTRRLEKYLQATENIKVTPDTTIEQSQPVPVKPDNVKAVPIQRKVSRNNKPIPSVVAKPKNVPKVYPATASKVERPKVLVRKPVPKLPIQRLKLPKQPENPHIKIKRRAATDTQVQLSRQPSIKKENIKAKPNDQATLKRMLERTLLENAALKEEVESLKVENAKLKKSSDVH